MSEAARIAHTQEPDPFAVHPDGTEWPDAEMEGSRPSRRAKKPIKLGSTAHKKKKPPNLEAKTRELLREMGFVYGKTEQYNAHTGQRKDLFGCIDGIAVKAGRVWFVQTCARSAFAPHLRKMATGEFKIGNGTPFDSFDATRHLADHWFKIGDDVPVALVIVMWDQPAGEGTLWRHEIRRITIEDLEECRARARKRDVGKP